MPGDVLLFQRLSVSTIGAVWFHDRVRDGIGWVTDAMATKQWSRRNRGVNRCTFGCDDLAVSSAIGRTCWCRLVVDGGILRFLRMQETV